jgi:superfamily I DNA/RNA helicase
MSRIILLDEPAIRECVESNLYQSSKFENGANLANALNGDKTIVAISPRLVPRWEKTTLYLLQSRIETGYLVIDSIVLESLPQGTSKATVLDDTLLVFQRICRFALKIWNRHKFSQSESWIAKTDRGIVFPYPYSSHTGFRVTLRRGYDDHRLAVRHGTRHLFAFAAGLQEIANSTDSQERAYKGAFNELTSERTSLEVEIKKIETIPNDAGYHELFLTEANHTGIRHQSYDTWLTRLTTEQRRFVTSGDIAPQRVEGPAGTGKTLCLLLRSFYLCKTAHAAQTECRVLFVSHSEATRAATEVALDSLGDPFYHRNSPTDTLQSIELQTLQRWCGTFLGERDISASQYLDQDALGAKEMRKLLIQEVVKTRLAEDPKSLEYLSEGCASFFKSENCEYISEMLQHEIGVMIKGRASESLEAYLILPQLAYCLPTESENDRRFVYSIYNEYQQQLNQSGVFDTDDIVLSTLGRLNTPIWRRRRTKEGYDAIIIDETHLFNLNELSLFHHLLRNANQPRIIFSIDRSQAPGERGITTRLVREVLTHSDKEEQETRAQLVFRSSPAIVRLAEAITAAGATLFTTFENPLSDVSSVITAADEDLAEDPIYWKCANDKDMCQLAVLRTKELCNRLKCPPSDIVIIAMTESLLPELVSQLNSESIKFVRLLHRGDIDLVRQGAKERALIVSHPDYVGGLEFKAVLILGVDEGRVPETEGVVKEESKHFLEFKACNRLYVAVSRARLALELFYSKERGRSSLLERALEIKAIEERQS